ncbi:MAG: CBS domain-containing protein [Deltaproteobacteria bacterium]
MATAWPKESVRVAAQRMAEHDVGTLVVVDPDGSTQALGIVTDRDVTTRCVAGNLDPDRTPVSRVMTRPVHTIDEHASIEDALAKMAVAGTRRLVVIGGGKAALGIVSLDDVLDMLTEENAAIGHLLEKQKPHVTV